MDNLLAVVLCGGESRRMGRDKGLLPAGKTIWSLSAASKLDPFGIPVLFSVNEKQVESYSSHISPDRLITDSITVNGPLKGLLSVHKKFPGKDILLLACDMPDLDGATIQKIITAYRQIRITASPQQKQYDFFVYQDQGFAQPFCGIYTARGLAKEYVSVLRHDQPVLPVRSDRFKDADRSEAPDGPSLPDFSLQSMLNKGITKRLEIDRMDAFKNYNSFDGK